MAPTSATGETQPEAQSSILVTGGAGFIGTHTVLQLLKEGFLVTVVDNLDNSVPETIDRVRHLAGPKLAQNLHFLIGDLRNEDDLETVFSRGRYDAVIHFAALKAVGESVAKPRLYYNNNLVGTIKLYEYMAKYGCKMMVFSSSATVYGQPEKIPCVEDSQLKAMNPYGRTKLFLEEISRDIQKADPEWRIILLRYFNPVGAHESGQIGEDPKAFYPLCFILVNLTTDSRLHSCHGFSRWSHSTIAALRKLFATDNIGCAAYNLGTGCGTSVLEMVAAFKKASGTKIPIKLCPRRSGDATAVFASIEKAKKELGWRAKYGIEEMCRDQWKWASQNPYGYVSQSNVETAKRE